MAAALYQVVFGVVQPLFNLYTVFAFLLTLICGFLITPAMSATIIPKYKELDRHKKAYWNTLPASSFHSIVLSLVTCYLMLFDQLKDEYIFSQSPIGRALLRFSVGYFCADFILIMLDSKMRRDTLSVIHHILGMFGIWLGIYYDGVAMYWIVYRFITETSTPFVNFLHCLRAVDYPKNAPLFVANSLLLIATFYLCRIVIIPYHWYGLYYYVYTDPSMTTIWPVLIQYWTVITFVLFDALNVTWTYKLTKGACKMVKQLRKSSD